MARYFLDSSALVKRYHLELGSGDTEELFRRGGDRFLVSRLALVELHSSFARLVRERVLTVDDLAKLTARLNDDVANGLLSVAAVTSRRLDEASTLLQVYGVAATIRTLDTIHLATAQALDSRGRIAAFVAADKKLLAVAAAACGFVTMDVG